jgi:hypothetical protein
MPMRLITYNYNNHKNKAFLEKEAIVNKTKA